ncbi:MAG: PDGLE domain-containing protein [Candidatus Geothermincolia bacterium]
MNEKRKNMLVFVAAGLALSLALALFLAPLASSEPDGLERVALDQGFEERAHEDPAWTGSPIPDYEIPGLGETRPAWATALAGLAGTATVFLMAWGLARLLKKREGMPDANRVTG